MLAAVVAFALILGACQGDVTWPIPAVSWWYSPDNNWPFLIQQVSTHVNVVTSVMIYCGPEVADNGPS